MGATGWTIIGVALTVVLVILGVRADRYLKRQESRDTAEAAAKRQGRPVITPGGIDSGPTADRVHHEYKVENAGQAPITALWLWIEDGSGKTVSTPAGGNVALAPEGPPIFAGLDVHQPLPKEQTILVKWKDADGEHTEPTGINPPQHA